MSIPKQIIPSTNLYYPEYVGESPYDITVESGPSIASKSTAEGEGLYKATVSKLSEIIITSRDFASAPLDNQEDNYSLSLTRKDGTTTGELLFTAVYITGTIGQYRATYVPTKQGFYNLDITLLGEPIKDSPFSVIVSTGDISAEYSIVTIDLDANSEISIDAGKTKLFTIDSYDLFGSDITTGGHSDDITIMATFTAGTEPQSPISEPFSSDWELASVTQVAGVVQDLGDGTYTGQITTRKAGTYTLDVLITGISNTVPLWTMIVSPESVYAPLSVAQSPPTEADAGSVIVIQVQGRDYYGNNAETLISSITSKSATLKHLATNTEATATFTDGATGAYDVEFTPTMSGAHELSIIIENEHISGSPFSINVNPGSTTNAPVTTITDFEFSYKAGESIEFTIESRDVNGNIREDSTDVFDVTLVNADSSITLTPTAVANGNGTYSVSQKITEIGTYTLTVQLSAVEVAQSPYVGIVVTPDDIAAVKSYFSTFEQSVTAGTSYIYKVQARDISCNGVTRDDEYHQFFVSLFNTDTHEVTQHNLTYKFGVYEANLSFSNAGTYEAALGLISNGGLRASYYQTISFYDLYDSRVPLYYHGEIGPQYYTQIDSTIDIDSDYLAVLDNYPSEYFSIKWEGKIMVPHNGKFRFYVDTDDFYTVKLSIGSETLIDLYKSAPGVIYSSDNFFADKVLVKDVLYDITIQYSERIGQSQIRFYWESDQIAKQIVPEDYLFNVLYSGFECENCVSPTAEASSNDCLKEVLVNPQNSDPDQVVVLGDYSQAVALTEETITLESRDVHANLQNHQNDVFTVILTPVSGGTSVTGTITIVSDGIYQAKYTLSSTGEYSMAINLQPNGVGTSYAVQGSPFTVICTDSTTDASQTDVSQDFTKAFVGETLSLTVTVKDAQGNKRSTGGDTITAVLKDLSGTQSGSSWVVDNYDGTYTIQFQHDTTGTFEMHVTVNSVAIIDAEGDTTINFVAGLPSGKDSELYHSDIVTIDEQQTLTINAVDMFCNEVTVADYEVAFEVIGNHGLLSGTATEITDPTFISSYTASYTISAPNAGENSQCGNIGFSAYYVYQGLNVDYYANRWFAGKPAMTTREDQVQQNWGSGEIIPDVASDYISVIWTGYLKPSQSGDFTFTIRSNDGVKMTIGDQVVINKLTQTSADGSYITSVTEPVTLTLNQFVPIKVEYFEITGEAFIVLEWSHASITKEVIPASQLYSPLSSAVAIGGSTFTASTVYKPNSAQNIRQSDSSTYETTSLTIEWDKLEDTGCQDTYIKVTYEDSLNNVQESAQVGSDITSLKITSLTPNEVYEVAVVTTNDSGESVSDTLSLTPATLPGAPASITITPDAQSQLLIEYTKPADTGIGDQTIAIDAYLIEVDLGYGDGFMTLTELTSITSSTPVSYTHTGLIAGHTMTYRVSAKNMLGYGATVTDTGSAVSQPSKPASAPRNDASQTDSTAIYIEFDKVEYDGGSAIDHYIVAYAEDYDGTFDNTFTVTPAALAGSISTGLTKGMTYRFKYAAVNVLTFQSEYSDEVAILLAEIPSAPQNFERIDMSKLNAGTIRLQWEAPLEEGGSPVSMYNLYQNGKLIYEASNTELTYTVYNLNVGQTYVFAISAVNEVGEGSTSTLTQIAASVPSKMFRPTWKTSTSTSITVQWEIPSFNGGSDVTKYSIRRDNGPNTSFEAAVLTADASTLEYQLTGLNSLILTYRIQVAAVNAIGMGEYSTAYEFYAAAKPGAPEDIVVVSQSTSQVSLSWSAPTTSDCPVEGYKIWIEDVQKANSVLTLVYDGSRNSA